MLGIYLRLSKEDENSNSIENQLREGRQFAKANGYKKFEVYNEGQGISGGNEIKDRPELDRLMKDIASKKLGAVWFRHQNRLERNSLTFHLFSDLAKQMKINVFFGDKKADLTDPSQFLQASIMTAVNAFEIEKQRSQIKRTLLDNAKEGKATGGKHIPYGYKTDENKYLVIDPETSNVVELIFKRCLEGIGGGKIAKELNEMRVQTKNGALVWKQPTIHSIIKNPAYKGKKRFRDKHYPIPPILNKEIWNKAQKQLKLNVAFKGKRVEHKYLLKHLTYCGKCGCPMHVMNYNKIIRYYRCSSARNGDNCHNPYFRIDALENLIWGLFEFNTLYEGVETHLTGEGNAGKLKELSAEKISLEDKLLSVGGKLQRTIDLVVEGLVEKDEIDKTRKKVEGEKETLEKKIENLDEQITALSDQNKLKKQVKKDLSKFKTGMKEAMETLFESTGKDLTKLKDGGVERFVEMFTNTTSKAEKLDGMPYNEKRELIKKYIKSIEITGINQGFLIHIKYTLPFESLIEVSKNYEHAIDLKSSKYINFDLLGQNKEYKDTEKKAIAKMLLRYM
jgi:DNA invertase Pin-like site-specific DNA recombinase